MLGGDFLFGGGISFGKVWGDIVQRVRMDFGGFLKFWGAVGAIYCQTDRFCHVNELLKGDNCHSMCHLTRKAGRTFERMDTKCKPNAQNHDIFIHY